MSPIIRPLPDTILVVLMHITVAMKQPSVLGANIVRVLMFETKPHYVRPDRWGAADVRERAVRNGSDQFNILVGAPIGLNLARSRVQHPYLVSKPSLAVIGLYTEAR